MEVSADSTNSTETNKVDISKDCDQEAEEEINHEFLSIHEVDNHGITYNDDKSTSDLETTSNNFWNGIKSIIYNVSTSNHCDCNSWDGNTKSLK